MNKTTNLGLSLYETTDKFAITAAEDSLNHNMELIDSASKQLEDKIENKQEKLTAGNNITIDENNVISAIVNNDGPSNTGGSSAIVDVVSLPTENINQNAIYRLMSAKLTWNGYDTYDGWQCHCVDSLPEEGHPVTTNMSDVISYYSIADNDVFGYVTNEIGGVAGVPAGWYSLTVLAPLFNVSYGGIVNDINDITNSTNYLLLSYEYYIYQNDWCKVPFAYDKAPKIDIKWDGNMDGRVALDMSMLGYDQGVYFVKVSDNIFTSDELTGWKYRLQYNDGSYSESDESADYWRIDTNTYPGAFTINDWIVILHDADTLANALGIPTGIYTNGIYFLLNSNAFVCSFTSPNRITRIDIKYVDLSGLSAVDVGGLAAVATSGSYYDLYNRPTVAEDVIRYSVTQSLSSTNKSIARSNIDVYSKSEVDTKISNIDVDADLSEYAKTSEVETMIANAIGSAIGGSY